MKVERKDTKLFTPIIITIETEGEANLLWHRLNVTDGILKEYCNDNGIDLSAIGSDAMFSTFDNLYTPEGF